jgi:hypothetical protein
MIAFRDGELVNDFAQWINSLTTQLAVLGDLEAGAIPQGGDENVLCRPG